MENLSPLKNNINSKLDILNYQINSLNSNKKQLLNTLKYDDLSEIEYLHFENRLAIVETLLERLYVEKLDLCNSNSKPV